MKKKILFFCAIPSQFPDLFPVARLLRETDAFHPIFVFDTSRGDNIECINSCLAQGLSCLSHSNPDKFIKASEANVDQENIRKKTVDIKKILPDKLKNVLRKLLYLSYCLYSAFKYIGKNVSLSQKIISIHKPDLLVVPIETVGYFYDPVIPIARKNGIPVMVIPFCFVRTTSTANWFLSQPSFRDVYSCHSLVNRLVCKRFPSWVIEHGGEKILRASFAWVLAYTYFNISKEHPWIDNRGYSNVIAVESRYAAELYKSEGVPSDKIKVTGNILHDIMFNLLSKKCAHRKKLFDELGFVFNDKTKVVLLSLPDEFDFSNRPGCEYATHEEIRRVMLEPLLRYENVKVVISLHPRLSYTKVKCLEQPGAHISLNPIAELLTCADLFVTVTSAAIRLAISCAIPVVDYDVFRYGDMYYSSAGGVVTINNKRDYYETVEKVITNDEVYNRLKARQEKAALLWGKPDGSAGARLLSLINGLVNKKTN